MTIHSCANSPNYFLYRWVGHVECGASANPCIWIRGAS